MFFSRKWPEGYGFPACYDCNHGSKDDDAIIAVCSRIHSGNRDLTQAQEQEWRKQLRAFHERHPGEAQKMLVTANEKRRFLTAAGARPPAGMAYGDVAVLRFTPFIRQTIDRFSRKLTLALHYKHTGKIVPADAWVETRFWTNFQFAVDQVPEEIFKLIPARADLRRDNVSLNDQCSYIFGVTPDGQNGVYVVAFRMSFVVFGTVVFDASLMDDVSTSIDNVLPGSDQEQRRAE
jgi:hypothetical protein